MPLITCRNLGGIGRFGNMLALYCFVRGYAERYGFELATSNWIGRRIFENVNEPLVTEEIAHFPQTRLDSETREPLDRYFGRSEIDIKVYAQSQLYVDGFYTRENMRQWLKFKPEYEALRPTAPPVTVAHIRRGDYTDNLSFTKFYCAVSDESYDNAVAQFGIPKPVIKVFEGWRPNPPNTPRECSWLPDFLMLRDAQYLLRANSTFSMFASWLGNGVTYSPVVESKVGMQTVPFVLGNHSCTAGIFRNQSDIFVP